MPFSSLNINPANLPSEPEKLKSYGLIKILVLGLIGIGLSILASHFFKTFLVGADANDLVKSMIIAAAFVIILILEMLFVNQTVFIYALIFLQAIAPLSLFMSKLYPDFSQALVGGAVVSFLFFFLGVYRSREILSNSLEIKFFSIVKPLVPKAATAVLLFFSIIFYLSYFEWGVFNETLARKFADGLFEAADPAVKVWFPKASLDQKMDDFLAVVAEGELRKMSNKELAEKGPGGAEFNFDLLKPEEKKKFVGQITEKVRVSLEGVLGPIDGEESVKDVAYRIIKDYVSGLYERIGYKSLFGAGVAFLMFLILRSSTFLFYWLVEFIALVAYKLLIAAGFAYVSLENARKETIVI